MKHAVERIAASVLLCAVLSGCRASQNTAAAPEKPDTQNRTYQMGEVLERTEDYTVQEIYVVCKDRTLYGTAYLPEQPVGPAVIMSHGYMDRYVRFQPYGEQLAEAGIAGYTFDFYGGSPSSRSGKDINKMSVLTEEEDLNAVIDAMLALGLSESGELYLMGHSQGGLVSAMAANDREEDIAGMALIAPAFMIPDMADNEYYAAMFQGLKKYIRDAKTVKIYDDIDDYDGPVWIVQGDRDELVPLSYAEGAADAYPNAELTVLRGEKHGIVSTLQHSIGEQVIEFILN